MKRNSIWTLCWVLLLIGVMTWVMFGVLDSPLAPGIALIAACVLGNLLIQPRWEKYSREVKADYSLSKKERFFRQVMGYVVSMILTLAIFAAAYLILWLCGVPS